ncbi:UDP-N-acetylmuramoyl-L-alanine--D-glutamate ligase [Paratissierella segnis]|uniref:UDP-N-acetylmuramoylalanine--D-glutamate ligase n=1 Tax=Paratissierella segnis TaxID=2763679 RepID=A0A926EY21_9FIRM|nr:UDP-N-acetylmuramoyl-L-alanine--D-glutamate ligase [Paratissierella segnis]MBC8588499.1 UDP-N-acetylmuramoyl-L-alanine--D-glutamate ligase [Paratissierella segnis]
MILKDKRVLVLGLGISGLSIIKAINKLGVDIVVYDAKSEEELKELLQQIKDIKIEYYLGNDEIKLEGIDLAVKSPGIPPYDPLVKRIIDENIEVVSDIELAYRISPTQNIISITGTNGKTTTTMLTGEIFKKAKLNTYVVGNIGVGILDKIIDAKKDDAFIVETSSFQLEYTKYFKPKVSTILNITPDHIDWHGSYENYKRAKLKAVKNLNYEDFVVLNYDDIYLKSIINDIKSNVILFSTNNLLDKGIYIEKENIIINNGIDKTKLMSIEDIKLIGKHNLENALASVGIALAMGIDIDIIRKTLSSFEGVEHRLEFVSRKNGINFYNDSKGTNPDASIKAIEAIEKPIILIAGGYDKGSLFDEFIKVCKGKVKALILLGHTKRKIEETAIRYGIDNIHLVENMKDAVDLAYKLGIRGDNVLLSPACASWDMYKNFEERGCDFKTNVHQLME